MLQMLEATPAMMKLTVSVDVPNCPQCGAVAVKIGERQRLCNGCGLTWERVTPDDELDADADRLIRSRGWNEDEGRAKPLGKFSTRW